jgi:hypothetical protein
VPEYDSWQEFSVRSDWESMKGSTLELNGHGSQ